MQTQVYPIVLFLLILSALLEQWLGGRDYFALPGDI